MKRHPGADCFSLHLVIIDSLDAPDIDLRRALISKPYKGTLEWALQNPVLTSWLQIGDGIFWINGKPASGKSTLMKFIFKHKDTRQLLHDWKRGAIEIHAGFFFNFRGSHIQKSFEGLLRSMLRQILEGAPFCKDLLKPLLFDPQYRASIANPPRIEWTIPLLEAALRAILGQDQKVLDIFLFLDALDEFDGHLNLISQFLKDLVEVSKSSKTRVKICFSSRPWDVFKDNFGSGLKLSVEDFTQTDIAQYCAGLVAQAPPPTVIPNELVLDIVAKAAGVFLWVKLVVTDILAAVRSTPDISVNELKLIVKKLPQELDEYYEHIVRRVPISYRWETYVLLELVIRNEEDNSRLSLEYAKSAMAVSRCQTYFEAEAALRKLQDSDQLSRENWAQFVRSRSGGLLEVQSTQTSYDLLDSFLQVMHQTVFEFVTSLRFKNLVLGDLSKITSDNGYSFHFKYRCVDIQRHEYLAYRYAMLAEATTGQSQANFIKSIPSHEFPDGLRRKSVTSPLGFATASKLVLCVRDLVQNRSLFNSTTRDPLLFNTLLEFSVTDLNTNMPPRRLWPLCLGILPLLLENGYHPEMEPAFFEFILCMLDRSCNVLLDNVVYNPGQQMSIENELFGIYRDVRFEANIDAEFLVSVAMALLDHGQNPNQFSSGQSKEWIPKGTESGHERRRRDYARQVGQPPLHAAPPPLARKLISCGANVRSVDANGYSALDLALVCLHLPKQKNWGYWYNLACLLAESGVPLLKGEIRIDFQLLEELKSSSKETFALSQYIRDAGPGCVIDIRASQGIPERTQPQTPQAHTKKESKWKVKNLFK